MGERAAAPRGRQRADKRHPRNVHQRCHVRSWPHRSACFTRYRPGGIPNPGARFDRLRPCLRGDGRGRPLRDQHGPLRNPAALSQARPQRTMRSRGVLPSELPRPLHRGGASARTRPLPTAGARARALFSRPRSPREGLAAASFGCVIMTESFGQGLYRMRLGQGPVYNPGRSRGGRQTQ